MFSKLVCIRKELTRVITGLSEKFDRARKIPATLEVHGERHGNPRGLAMIAAKQGFASLTVQQHAAVGQEIGVEMILKSACANR